MHHDSLHPLRRRGWLPAKGGRRTLARFRADVAALPAPSWRGFLWARVRLAASVAALRRAEALGAG